MSVSVYLKIGGVCVSLKRTNKYEASAEFGSAVLLSREGCSQRRMEQKIERLCVCEFYKYFEMASKLTHLFKSKRVGNLASDKKVPKTSPLGCLLAHWGEIHDDLCKSQMIEYCNHWWPFYVLEDEKKWPTNGTLSYNTILQLMLFCRREGKWNEVPYVDLFFYLRQ